MGMIYRRKKKLPDGTLAETGPYWIKYYRNGKAFCESSGTEKQSEAKRLLKQKEGDVARGLPPIAKAGRILIDELLNNVITDYRIKHYDSLPDLEGRIKNHLLPFFGGRRAVNVTTADVREFIAKRQEEKARDVTINRDLAALKRAYVMAVKDGKLLYRPKIEMLPEDNVRQGFFEKEQFEAVRKHLPERYRPVVTFCYITGWRSLSEVLPLQWRQVDFKEGMVRLEPGTTKNKEGQSFPFTEELRELLEDLRAKTDALEKERGIIIPFVFHRGGLPIKDFRVTWKTACIKAGVPGKIMHDFRRTAVRRLERAGVSRSVAIKMTGHKTEFVYRRYAITSVNDLREAAQKLDGLTVTKRLQSAQFHVQSEK